MPNAICYARVSTEEQTQSGLSIDWQKQVMKHESERRGYSTIEIIDDGYSGKNLKRPGIQRALTMLKKGEADVLMFAKLDRVSRSVIDFSNLMATAEREGWKINILDLNVDTTTPNGKMIARIMVTMAEWERDQISARTKAGMSMLKAKGKRAGRKKSIKPATERYVKALRAQGLSIREIATRLNSEAIPSASGSSWYTTSVARLI